MFDSKLSSKRYHIFISAGEASGDLHASNLVQQVKHFIPRANISDIDPGNIQFCGMGGALMRQAGVKILQDSTELGVIGGIEVLRHFVKIFQVMRLLKRELIKNPPHLLILIDYPGFNLWLAKIAHKLGIKVLYYISPQIWAWHYSRIKKIRRYVNMMAVVFPFEVALYTKAHVPVTLVRHPLLDSVQPTLLKNLAKNAFGLDQEAPIVGLFPGSRNNEVKYIFPVMLEVAKTLQAKYPTMQFVLPLASSLNVETFTSYLHEYPQLNVRIIDNQTYDAANICNAIIATSGTVTLEIALLGIPMVIVYKLTELTYRIVKRIIKIPYIGLCNIVAGKKIVRELIQHDANVQNISAEIIKIMEDKIYRANMIMELQQVRHMLAPAGSSTDIANIVIDMLRTEMD